ncbi:MAG: 4-oxalomesaconate tautomerase [Marivita sp.]|uniref:4-oxalomesaconate tautomerase n=1 Tax=Marivita sp. TaxID=2003365 RepID=UPI001B121AF4|nr:4-oxalomesaconate tautomerase [Marivita sp.]MBO6883639.1 4-oxalomesaconate tautomerase [Marivita sp.]
MSDGIRCMWMRGGTSKGGYFLAEDLSADRDAFLMRVMGSPDARQIDGMGGADPLTSKVAVVKRSDRPGVDVDYLFLQVAVDQPQVSDGQNCGNILAGVAPFAIERGLVPGQDGQTRVAIYMENTGQTAIATVQTPGGMPTYTGDASIDGVPGTAAAIPLEFVGTAGSTCGALLPTGNTHDQVDGVDVTMIDNGMPVVLLRASDLRINGTERREALEANDELKARLEAIRLACGQVMNLGDVAQKTVPKMTLVSAPRRGGVIATRTFIPHRCHASIGVLGAVSVATACLLPGSVTEGLAQVPEGSEKRMPIEHPSGETSIIAQVSASGEVTSAAVLRTARKLMDGVVFG